VFEIAAHGLPAVLIPYPHAAAGHQLTNARWMADAGAAVLLADADLSPERLRATVDELLGEPARREAMAVAAHALARPDAASDVAGELMRAAA
jgi:UDP-N-acetylglucosamine--N-acetylmuramyl-(pentapeptide) pyrophosphoryl-undecaprenol N-acetylglucosamine transferase